MSDNDINDQNWNTVVIRRKVSKVSVGSGPVRSNVSKLMQTLDTSDDIPRAIIKKLSAESRNSIVQKRIELGLDQSKLNTACAFPMYLIRDIESGKLHPTPKQLTMINVKLKLALRYE